MNGWRRLHGPVGAERDDLDVRHADAEALRQDLHRFGLLVLRGQHLSPAELVAFGNRLGELEIYPFADALPDQPCVVRIVKEPQDVSNFGGAWHTDTAYLPEPPAVTALQAVEVPEQGGDTLFADMISVYEGLSPGYQATLSDLTGFNTSTLVHADGAGYGGVVGQSVPLKQTDVVTEAEHPLVIDSGGRSALYFSLIHTSHFVGMSRLESLPILEALHALATAAENVSRLRWEAGTLAIWDNRAVQHYPLNDYGGARREMLRIILRGDRPAAAP